MTKKIVFTVCCFGVCFCSAYSQKYVPPENTTLVMIGQDQANIEEYISAVGSVPAGCMFYTSIQRLEGLDAPHDAGAGIGYADYFVRAYPDMVIQLGLYMVDALDDINQGRYDEHIDMLGAWIAGTQRPVYLRIGYEFDGPHNHYDPQAYQTAFRRIVDRFKENNISNVAYVWHSYAAYSPRPVQSWYPGDAYVDWVGISYFNSTSGYTEAVIAYAKSRGKPLMLAEATPAGIGVRYGTEAVRRWFEPVFTFIKKHDVRAFCYINCDWDAMPMWKDMHWKDSRVQANPIVQDAWDDEIRKPRYIHSSASLYALLGYSKKNQ